MDTLFSEDIHFQLPDAEISYYPNFLNKQEADDHFISFKTAIPWRQDDITVFGKTYAQPRLTALFANNTLPYSYANITMHPEVFSRELLQIKAAIEAIEPTVFTTCLANLYRDGKDSNGWHADDEKELGQNPVIASVTLGQERWFHLKHKEDKSLKQKILLCHGSLLIMKGPTQHFWKHQIPKTTKPIGERINLTFRVIK